MDPLVFVGSAALVVVSITTHEASHGFVANRLGDPTAREAGRLTLNPIPHIDPFLTILLPLFLLLTGTGIIFGGARPVPVNVSRLRNPRRDWALVGAAGPLSNLAIALGLALVLSVLAHLGGVAPGSRIATILAVGIFVNVLLAVFNLIPIPPLDGSRVVQYALSGSALAAYQQLERFGLIVIVALVFFFRPLQIFLVDAIVTCSAILTAPLGVWPDMEPVLRQALLGWARRSAGGASRHRPRTRVERGSYGPAASDLGQQPLSIPGPQPPRPFESWHRHCSKDAKRARRAWHAEIAGEGWGAHSRVALLAEAAAPGVVNVHTSKTLHQQIGSGSLLPFLFGDLFGAPLSRDPGSDLAVEAHDQARELDAADDTTLLLVRRGQATIFVPLIYARS